MIQDNKKVTKKKRAESRKTDKEDNEYIIRKPKKLLHRPHPRLFTDAVNQMSKAQKQWVREAGFEHLLSFSMKKIPKNTTINVVWWFDYDNFSLNLSDNCIIRITEKDVHEILGLPRGDTEIKMVSDEVTLADWRSQFGLDREGHKITEKMVYRALT